MYNVASYREAVSEAADRLAGEAELAGPRYIVSFLAACYEFLYQMLVKAESSLHAFA